MEDHTYAAGHLTIRFYAEIPERLLGTCKAHPFARILWGIGHGHLIPEIIPDIDVVANPDQVGDVFPLQILYGAVTDF
jgi:hypothetical protein